MLIALVFSLALNLLGPIGIQLEHEVQEMLVAVTYAVVVFSIVFQGLTIGPLIRSIK
ncbi:MAG: hypothetical protein QNL87_05590 [Gammaproteobacteria bacterium]|nr:hypothetical protein [Gammaproteobacteria bacterium]